MTAPNLDQQLAIDTTSGPLLIIAGPGSGKTFTLVERIVRLIEAEGADPNSNTVRTYYPDFLFERDDGKLVIVEVKGDHQVDDPVVRAKREFAEQMAVASGMTYQLIKGTDAEAHSYQRLLN